VGVVRSFLPDPDLPLLPGPAAFRPSRERRPAGPDILATDADEHQLERARVAQYPASSLKEVPVLWRDAAFEQVGRLFRLKPEFRGDVHFEQQDIGQAMPSGPFDLILCRNLVFTYFAPDRRPEMTERLAARLRPGGALVIGAREVLPGAAGELIPWFAPLPIYRRAPRSSVGKPWTPRGQ
jgi:chemotaxis protein methyltransferase CheR